MSPTLHLRLTCLKELKFEGNPIREFQGHSQNLFKILEDSCTLHLKSQRVSVQEDVWSSARHSICDLLLPEHMAVLINYTHLGPYCSPQDRECFHLQQFTRRRRRKKSSRVQSSGSQQHHFYLWLVEPYWIILFETEWEEVHYTLRNKNQPEWYQRELRVIWGKKTPLCISFEVTTDDQKLSKCFCLC